MSSDIFPPPAVGAVRLAWSNVRTPEFRTLIEDSANGLEARTSKWVYPRWRWTLSYPAIGQAGHQFGDQLRAVVGHFLKHRGAGDSFLFRDPEDFSVVNQLVGVGNGATKNFQIIRNYGGFIEPIFEVKSGTLAVRKAGVTQTPTTHYTEDDGLVQFITAPAVGQEVRVDCEFYFRVRFDADTQDFENFTYLLHAMREVRLVSVKR